MGWTYLVLMAIVVVAEAAARKAVYPDVEVGSAVPDCDEIAAVAGRR